jgi:hypothetical protein
MCRSPSPQSGPRWPRCRPKSQSWPWPSDKGTRKRASDGGRSHP